MQRRWLVWVSAVGIAAATFVIGALAFILPLRASALDCQTCGSDDENPYGDYIGMMELGGSVSGFGGTAGNVINYSEIYITPLDTIESCPSGGPPRCVVCNGVSSCQEACYGGYTCRFERRWDRGKMKIISCTMALTCSS